MALPAMSILLFWATPLLLNKLPVLGSECVPLTTYQTSQFENSNCGHE
jgi:hypothetical protein